MGKWIDADALIDRLDYCVKEGMGSTIAFTFKHMVEEAPSIDIEPKRGEWIRSSEIDIAWGSKIYTCSNCGRKQNDMTNFCPNCGAEMREREGE